MGVFVCIKLFIENRILFFSINVLHLYVQKRVDCKQKVCPMVNRKLTIKERRTLNEYLENGNIEKCTERNADRTLKRPHVIQAMQEALERQGLTEDCLAKKAKDLLNAKETKFFQHEGRVVNEREVDALSIQLNTLTLIGKWKGLDKQTVDMNHTGYIDHSLYDLSNCTDEELNAIIANCDKESSTDS